MHIAAGVAGTAAAFTCYAVIIIITHITVGSNYLMAAACGVAFCLSYTRMFFSVSCGPFSILDYMHLFNIAL